MKRFIKVSLIALLVLSTVFTISIFAAPGDSSDPVVVLSYITDTLLPKIQDMIDTSIREYDKEKSKEESKEEESKPQTVETFMAPVENSFTTVNMKKGETIICSLGAQMIVRMGSVKVIATEKGGICNTTAGVDIKNGENAPANSLLVVPAGDGRGLRAENDVIVLVKGSYSLYK